MLLLLPEIIKPFILLEKGRLLKIGVTDYESNLECTIISLHRLKAIMP